MSTAAAAAPLGRGLENNLSVLSRPAADFLARRHGMHIGGATRFGRGALMPVLDPTSTEVVAEIPAGDAHDVDQAVTAARAAFDNGPWSRIKPHVRAHLILKLADAIEANAAALAEVEAVNSGRLLVNTRLFDVDLSVHVLRYFAGFATRIQGKTVDLSVPYLPDASFVGFTRRDPVGVVAGITPWNVPLCQAVWKAAPALATGCTLVLKPAEQTPLTALWFAELAQEVGIPAGVINVVTGTGAEAGAALVSHPGIDKISFTGSTATGRSIAALAGGALKPCSVELGGKSPVVILEDADLEAAIPGAAWAIFGNHGQNCCAGSRLYVHERHFDAVVEGVAKIATQIKLGPGLAPDSQMGPLISRQQKSRVLGYIADARAAGATVVAGGGSPEVRGSYVEPTVLTRVRADMRAVSEEIFGPVLVAMPFKEHAEAVGLANQSAYGLGASVWTRDISAAHRFIRAFQAGTVWVNNHNVLDMALPFGGLKDSGLGHELSEEAINSHTHLKSVVLRV
jgi:phenylacetaldehyde dehydrogenase